MSEFTEMLPEVQTDELPDTDEAPIEESILCDRCGAQLAGLSRATVTQPGVGPLPYCLIPCLPIIRAVGLPEGTTVETFTVGA